MAKADKALAARRTEEILRIRLDGAAWWDVVQFVREKEQESGSLWCVPEGANPLSQAMIRKYQERADQMMMASFDKSRKRRFRQSFAKRDALFARAVAAGELSVALAVLKDQDTLFGLYPSPAVELGKTVDELTRRLAALEKTDDTTNTAGVPGNDDDGSAEPARAADPAANRGEGNEGDGTACPVAR